MERIDVRSMGLWAAAAAILLLMLMGCAADGENARAQRDADQRWQLGPLVDDNGHHRSLSLDSPAMNELHEFQPWLTSGPRWYDGRVDTARQVRAGTRSLVVDRAFTNQRDRVNSNNGRVRDSFRQTVDVERFIEVER